MDLISDILSKLVEVQSALIRNTPTLTTQPLAGHRQKPLGNA